jgi:hypothetical protein
MIHSAHVVSNVRVPYSEVSQPGAGIHIRGARLTRCALAAG